MLGCLKKLKVTHHWILPKALQNDFCWVSKDHLSINTIAAMFTGSTSSETNAYDFFSDDNKIKWNGIFLDALNVVSLSGKKHDCVTFLCVVSLAHDQRQF